MQSCLAASATLAAIFLKSESTMGKISAAPVYTKKKWLIQLRKINDEWKWKGIGKGRNSIPGPARPTEEVAEGLAWTRTSLKAELLLLKKWSRVHFRAYALCSLSSIATNITGCGFSDSSEFFELAIPKTQLLSFLFLSLLHLLQTQHNSLIYIYIYISIFIFIFFIFLY